MYYLVFFKGKAAALTCWTKHALSRKTEDGWEVETHDDWPEPRSFQNLLEEKVNDDAPANVGKITVDNFCEKYVEVT